MDGLRDCKSAFRLANVADDWADDNNAFIDSLLPNGSTRSVLTYQLQFVDFCKVAGACPLPASADTVMGFMRHLLDRKLSRSTINKTAVSAISALHREFDIPSPTLNARVKLLKRGVTRHTRPPKAKTPVTLAMLLEMAKKVDLTSFLEVRDMTMFLLMFYFLMRESEAVALRLSDLKTQEFDGNKILSMMFATHEPTKNDPESKGDCVVVEQAEDVRLCPITWTSLYLELRGDRKSPYLFVNGRQADKSVSKLGDKLPNQRLKARCRQVGLDPAEFSSHCLRHGGATAAAAGGAIERLLKAHGRWRSDCVRVYITDTLRNRLLVSRAMMLAT
jgi:integrase